jgi:hypothetical protein
MESLEQIKLTLKTSSTFGILLEENPEEYEFLAQEALKQAICQKGIPALTLPDRLPDELRQKWSPISPLAPCVAFPQKTSLSLPKDKYGIKEVTYQENQNNLTFIFTSKDNTLSRKDIVVEKLPPQAETVFCFFEEAEKINRFDRQIRLPEKQKIVHITKDRRTVTEKVFEIIQVLNPPLLENPAVPTLLLAALMSEIQNFVEDSGQQTLSLASRLLELGA